MQLSLEVGRFWSFALEFTRIPSMARRRPTGVALQVRRSGVFSNRKFGGSLTSSTVSVPVHKARRQHYLP
jgi:hypothetical protein